GSRRGGPRRWGATRGNGACWGHVPRGIQSRRRGFRGIRFQGILKKRVHEIAKQEGLTSKEVLAALKAAGIEAKVAASSVEEEDALKALAAATGDGAKADSKSAKAAPKDGSKKAKAAPASASKGADGKSAAQDKSGAARPARPEAPGSQPGGSGGRKRRRVVIDSQASR